MSIVIQHKNDRDRVRHYTIKAPIEEHFVMTMLSFQSTIRLMLLFQITIKKKYIRTNDFEMNLLMLL